MNNQPPTSFNTDPPFPGHIFALTPEQGAEMEATGLALQQIINDKATPETVAATLVSGIATLISLASGWAPLGELNETAWSGTLQSLPGGTHVLMLEEPQGGQQFTLRLDENDIPYAGEWEVSAATATSAEFRLLNSEGNWTLLLDDGNQQRTLPIGNDPGLNWGTAPGEVRLFAPTGATVTGVAEEIAPLVPEAPATPEVEPEEEELPSPVAPLAPNPPEQANDTVQQDNTPDPPQVDWYFLDGGNSCGPVSEAVLLQHLTAGECTLDTLVWNAAMTEWSTLTTALPAAVTAQSLSPIPPTPPPPPVAPPPPPMPVPVAATPVISWHYLLNGQQQGAVAEDTLQQLLAAGTLTADTLLWRDGMAEWLPVREAAPKLLPVLVEWYYLLNGQQNGPVSEADLRSWLQEGRLSADCMVWSAALSEWQEARSAGLIATAQPLTCRKCGAVITQNIRFCGRCGQSVS